MSWQARNDKPLVQLRILAIIAPRARLDGRQTCVARYHLLRRASQLHLPNALLALLLLLLLLLAEKEAPFSASFSENLPRRAGDSYQNLQETAAAN